MSRPFSFRATLRTPDDGKPKPGRHSDLVVVSPKQIYVGSLIEAKEWAYSQLESIDNANDKRSSHVDIYEIEERLVERVNPTPAIPPSQSSMVVTHPVADKLLPCVVCGRPSCSLHSQDRPNLHRKD